MKYENVKVGDEFLVKTRMTEKICKVESVSPKRFICGGHTFNKDFGQHIGGGMYNHASISTITDEERKKRIQEIEKRRLCKKLEDLSFKTFSLVELMAIDGYIARLKDK